MPEDYYNDGPDSQPGQDQSQSDDSGDSNSQTALLPRSVFGGEVNPGDYITLCVDKVDGDDVLCHKDEGKEKGEQQHMAEEPQNPSGDSTSGMSSMMED